MKHKSEGNKHSLKKICMKEKGQMTKGKTPKCLQRKTIQVATKKVE